MIINLWHNRLSMPKKDESWHRDDVAEELREFNDARGFLNYWSELSDVVYTYTRAHWSSHKIIKWPLKRWQFWWGLLYMFPKYTLRWTFYRRIGARLGKPKKLTEVRNYKKEAKLRHIAKKYMLNEETFIKEVKKLSKRWFFLP